MHSFVEHYLATKNASVEQFCEAALTFDTDVIIDIWKNLPEGTAANYVSKIRALRDFIGERNLRSCSASELQDILSQAGIVSVNHISRRKLNDEYAMSRQKEGSREAVANRLRALNTSDLRYFKNLIDQLLSPSSGKI